MPFGAIGNRAQAPVTYATGVAGQEEPITQYDPKPPKASPIAAHMGVNADQWPHMTDAPIVKRGQRMVGIRHLYARGAVKQPLQVVGREMAGPSLPISQFQPYLQGPIHDAGFNDRLYQAGYPGFNLALSFKVQQIQKQVTGPGQNMKMTSKPINVSINLQKLFRPGTPAQAANPVQVNP